jgi:hypothetical protein
MPSGKGSVAKKFYSGGRRTQQNQIEQVVTVSVGEGVMLPSPLEFLLRIIGGHRGG